MKPLPQETRVAKLAQQGVDMKEFIRSSPFKDEIAATNVEIAWVEVLGGEALFVPVDLQSAGYDGSTEDRLRGCGDRGCGDKGIRG